MEKKSFGVVVYFLAATTVYFKFNRKTVAERMNPFLGKVLQSLKKELAVNDN